MNGYQEELEHPVPELDQEVEDSIKAAPEISGKQVYYIAVCENHLLNESFVLRSYRTKMPKHWREEKVNDYGFCDRPIACENVTHLCARFKGHGGGCVAVHIEDTAGRKIRRLEYA